MPTRQVVADARRWRDVPEAHVVRRADAAVTAGTPPDGRALPELGERPPWSGSTRGSSSRRCWPEQSPQAQAVDWLAAALRVRCGWDVGW